MKIRSLCTALVIALVATGCGGASAPTTTQVGSRAPLTTTLAPEVLATSTTAPPVSTPPGFLPFKGDGFEIFVPKSWIVAGVGDLELDEVLDQMSRLSPDAVAVVEQTFAAGGKLFAFDFRNAAPTFTDNINILQLPPLNMSAAELVDVAAKELRGIGATNTDGRVESLPAGDAVIVSYELPRDLGGGEGISYTLLTPSHQWVVTYTALDSSRFQESFEIMMESFRER